MSPSRRKDNSKQRNKSSIILPRKKMKKLLMLKSIFLTYWDFLDRVTKLSIGKKNWRKN